MSAQEPSLSSAGASAPPPTAAAPSSTTAAPSATQVAEVPAGTDTSAAAGTSASQQPEGTTATQVAAGTAGLETPVSDLDFLSDDSELTRELFDTQNNRIPLEARDKWWAAEEGKRAAETSLQALGGQAGLQVAQELLPIVTNPQPTWADVDTFMDSLNTTNGNLAYGIAQSMMKGVISDEELYSPWRDQTIAKEFGTDVTLDRLKELNEADRKGLIPEDVLGQSVSPEVIALRKELADAKAEREQTKAERERTQTEAKRQAAEQVDSFIFRNVNDFVEPLAKKYGRLVEDGQENTPEGKAKIRFGEMQTAWLNERIRKQPEYTRLAHLRDTGKALNPDGTPTTLFKIHLDPLLNRAHALYKEAARDTQRMFASSQTSNGTRPPQPPGGPAQVPPLAPQKPVAEMTPDEQIEWSKQQYRASIRDIGTQAALTA